MKKQMLMIMSVLALNTIIAQQSSVVSTNSRTVTENYRIESKNNFDVKTTLANENYFKDMNAKNTPLIVKQLKQEVIKFNIQNSIVFDNSEDATYRVVFKNNRSKLVVKYNNHGEILSSIEKYKNIVIPVELRIAISKKYPDWAYQKNTFYITYNYGIGFKKSYKIQIGKGNLKKTLSL